MIEKVVEALKRVIIKRTVGLCGGMGGVVLESIVGSSESDGVVDRVVR